MMPCLLCHPETSRAPVHCSGARRDARPPHRGIGSGRVTLSEWKVDCRKAVSRPARDIHRHEHGTIPHASRSRARIEQRRQSSSRLERHADPHPQARTYETYCPWEMTHTRNSHAG